MDNLSYFTAELPAHEPENVFNPWTYLGNELQLQIPLGCIISNGICKVDHEENEGNLTINGISFQKRSSKQPPSSTAFSLHRKYSYFKLCFGAANDLDSSERNGYNENGKIKFQVLADEVPFKINGRIWITIDMTKSPVCFLVGVGNVNMIEIKTQYQSHPNSYGLTALIDAAVFPKGNFWVDLYLTLLCIILHYTLSVQKLLDKIFRSI